MPNENEKVNPIVWILVGYMWLFLHRPFEIWPIFATIRLERSYMIFTLMAWFAISPKIWNSNRNNIALLLIAFSILISTLLSPYQGFGNNQTTENWFKVFVFFLLLTTSVKTDKDFKVIVTAFTVCFTLYMLHSLREFLNGKGTYRMGIWRMVGVDSTMSDPNSFGSSINYALPLLLPLLVFTREQTTKRGKLMLYLLVLLSFALSLFCIQLTGSRGAFSVLGVGLLGLTLLSKYRIRILIGFLIVACIVWVTTPERHKIRYISIIDPSVLEGANMKGALASAQGRSAGFWGGINVWQQNLPFGVGPGCYQLTPGKTHQTHQLYSQILSELGTFGAIAYISLISAVFLNYVQSRMLLKKLKSLGREKEGLYFHKVSFAAAYVLLLLLVMGFGGHNGFRYNWVWYAAFQSLAVSLLKNKVDLLQSVKTPVSRILPAQPAVSPAR